MFNLQKDVFTYIMIAYRYLYLEKQGQTTQDYASSDSFFPTSSIQNKSLLSKF